MKRSAPKYFDGYETRETPEGKKLTYTGPWYGHARPGEGRSVRTAVSAWVCSMLLTCGLAEFLPSDGGMQRYMAIPSLWALVPMIFAVMGWVTFLTAGEKWKLRTLYSGYRRLKRSLIAELVLLCLWCAGELYFLVLHPTQLPGELYYLALLAVCTASAAMALRTVLVHPAVVVQGPDIR